jgi:Putative binding domain, N-terminal/Viral BACON domain
MPFLRRHRAWLFCFLLSLAAAACSESNFPVTPTPTARTPLVTQQTASYQGSILGSGGQVTFFNMTLIARSLGATFRLMEQAPGTTIVSGLFETGTGIEGTVEGTVDGSLHDGTVRLTLAVVHDGCTEQRIYTGLVTGSGVALTPGEITHSCPANALTFAVQATIPTSPGCSYSVTPTTLTMSGNGGTGTVTVTTNTDCPWVAEAAVPWLSVASTAIGSGSGSVLLMAQVNDGAARSGMARVAGQAVAITQGPQCSIAIAPTSAPVPASGATITVAITAPAGCSWSAETSEPWLSVAPRSGEGSGSVQVVAAANAGAQRQGTVAIGGQSLTVVQEANTPCVFAISPTSGSIGTFGGSGTVAVTTRADCSWTVNVGAATWLQVSPVSGTGNGTVTYSAGPNLGPARSATIVIAGQSFTVSQAGNVVTISVNINTTVPPGYSRSAGTVETTTSGKPDGRIRCSRFVDQPQIGTCTATFTITAPTQVTFLATPDPDYPGTQIQWDTCGAARECSLSINNGGTYPPMEVRLIRPIVIGATVRP